MDKEKSLQLAEVVLQKAREGKLNRKELLEEFEGRYGKQFPGLFSVIGYYFFGMPWLLWRMVRSFSFRNIKEIIKM